MVFRAKNDPGWPLAPTVADRRSADAATAPNTVARGVIQSSYPPSAYPAMNAMSQPSGRSPFCRAPRLLERWNEEIGRYPEAGTQPLHHCHAQFLLAPQDLTDSAWRSKDRDHIRSREPVLVHKVPDHFGRARRSARPLAFRIGSDQTCLRLEPSYIARFVRVP